MLGCEPFACEVHGMMSLNIKTRQYTSNLSRTTPWLLCIYALDIDCLQKKFDSIITSMFNTKSGPPLQKRKTSLLAGFIRYSSAVWCTMLHTSLDAVVKHQNHGRMSKAHIFSTCRRSPKSWQWDLKSDRSGQKNLISVGSISCQTSFASGGAPRSEETALH